MATLFAELTNEHTPADDLLLAAQACLQFILRRSWDYPQGITMLVLDEVCRLHELRAHDRKYVETLLIKMSALSSSVGMHGDLRFWRHDTAPIGSYNVRKGVYVGANMPRAKAEKKG